MKSLEHEAGQSVALIALALIVLVAFVGLAIDGARAYGERTKMQGAADSAAVAGTRALALGNSESTIYSQINEYSVSRNGASSFEAFYYSSSITGNRINGTGNVPNGMTGVCVTAISNFSTYFIGVIGIRTLRVSAQGCATQSTGACAGGYAIWAHSNSCDKTINWTGGSWIVNGKVHSNNDVYDTGNSNTINGTLEYVSTVGGSQSFILNPSTGNPVQVTASANYPVNYNIADYAPGGSAAVIASAAGKYFTHSGGYNGPWADGLHYLSGSGTAHISSLTSGNHQLTIVTANGNLGWSAPMGSGETVSPYIDGLFLYSTSASGSCTSGTPAINYSASGNAFTGIIYAPGGYLQVSGSSNTSLSGSLIADSIRLSGTGVDINYNPNLCTGTGSGIKLTNP